MKKVFIAGATGFIGMRLVEKLTEKYAVTVLSRNPYKAKSFLGSGIQALAWEPENPYMDLSDFYAVINLSGESIASGYWNAEKKKKILESRVKMTTFLANSIAHSSGKPDVFLSSSAVGYYGSSPGTRFTEESGRGEGFLAMVCDAWENATEKTSPKTRKVILRIGGVLGKDGGMLSKMILPYRFFAGGPFGSGKQFISWIHVDDVIRAIVFLMENKKSSGVYNLTAPNPANSREIATAIGKILHRPSFLPFPEFAAKIFLGEMGKELLLADQFVFPEHLLQDGFTFQHPHLEETLLDILGK